MLSIKTTQGYRRALKKLVRSGQFKIDKLEKVIDALVQGKKLPKSNKDHYLSGDLVGFRECHIQSDVLLVYYIEQDKLVLVLVNIGSHSNLFK
ncbi:MAG: type II toxin-antitoxin system YafQ family toxin [Candidatus Pacebacteria bacterium]|nr:type II toxin-antitoxin system YafQ family toxin [Candidatus Paceibacterota bacterium]